MKVPCHFFGGQLNRDRPSQRDCSIGEEAHCLDQEVSVAQTKNKKPKQAAVTTLVGELVAQVETLVAEVTWMKRELN